ncbi:MAG: hypothetical protein MK486_03045 [Gemmatimonadetes bacterium]|jgi:hypothetical protein|nr:hypothetical protein [Gemmatimonadota bacterium]|tara:strand:- start:406 stop:792 length:387 start_codon:yes stop_codon:yes gene_type:complete
MRRLSGPRWAALLALIALAGCEFGPKGPGVINGTIISPFNLGAVVLEVEGTGVRGFVGNGDTQAYGSVVPGVGGRHRVVLVSRSGSSIQFGIEVEDLRAETPIAIVVFAAGADNIPKLLAGTLVELEH